MQRRSQDAKVCKARVLDFVIQRSLVALVRAVVVVAGGQVHTVSPGVNRGRMGKWRAWVTPAPTHQCWEDSHQVGAGRGPGSGVTRERGEA